MGLIELKSVSRYYLVDKRKKYVLKDVTLSLPHRGIVTILGKSGSGKSTLLNLIGKIDEPSEGKIFFNNEDISSYKEKKLVNLRSHYFSYIFQHYHLLENQSAIFNVMLPALINGKSYKTAYQEAERLMNDFQLNKELFRKRAADLSGGEKERIAVLRAFINKPKVILADEPTGALDRRNAVLVMESLKSKSRHTLVILVTHNEVLARKYSDRIIHLHDGRITKDERINDCSSPYRAEKKSIAIHHNSWQGAIIRKNVIKRLKRNLFSISALSVGLVSSMLIFGFSNGSEESIILSTQKQFNYGVASLSKEHKIVSTDSPITLIQTMRPYEEEIEEISETCSDFHICYSYDALISPYPEVFVNDGEINNISYLPIYSFVDASSNKNLLIKGKIPTFDTLNQVVVNQTTYDLLKKETHQEPINTFVRIKDQHNYSYLTDKADENIITDYFTYDRLVQIVGVVEEMHFLNTPKIYYSYLALDKYMDETVLNNLSASQGETSWKTRVMEARNNEAISSYSYQLFLKDYRNANELKVLNNTLPEEYSLNSSALVIEETLFSLVDAASVGMEVFLIIALVGIALIMGIISFASYSEDIKDSAILLCLGAKRDDITSLYLVENSFVGLICVALSFAVTIFITQPINNLINHYTSLINIINIPFLRFHNHSYLFPLLIVVGALFISLMSTFIPIAFSKRISLKEELKAND